MVIAFLVSDSLGCPIFGGHHFIHSFHLYPIFLSPEGGPQGGLHKYKLYTNLYTLCSCMLYAENKLEFLLVNQHST